MRPARFSVFLFFGFLFSFPLAAQQTVQRDPQAVSILAQSVAVAGGVQALSGIQDFTATGTITYFWAGQEVQGPTTVRGLGVSNFRMDANLPDGTHSWVASEAEGSQKNPDGTVSELPWANQVKRLSLTWPYPPILAALNSSSAQISYAGQSSFEGHSAYDVRIEQILPASVDPKGASSSLTTRDFFIDSSTYLVVGITDVAYPEDFSRKRYAHEIEFSNYQVVNGLQVPFSVTEFITGQKTWTLQLSSVSFNSGLTSSDFVLQ